GARSSSREGTAVGRPRCAPAMQRARSSGSWRSSRFPSRVLHRSSDGRAATQTNSVALVVAMTSSPGYRFTGKLVSHWFRLEPLMPSLPPAINLVSHVHGEGPLVVGLHDIGQSGSEMLEALAPLTDRFRVVCPHLPRHRHAPP